LTTEKEVSKLRADLEQMQPLLEEAVQEAITTMQIISVDSQVAAETRAQVQKEEAEAIKKAKEAKAIADDAQRDLDEALPALVCNIFLLASVFGNFYL
jgi:dynein heavy chain